MSAAVDALVAVTPATSLAAAFGLAGGGYLTGREGVAACGAVAGGFGLIVGRLQTRSVRVRLRRERARNRGDLREVSRLLHEVRRGLADLRSDLDVVKAERDAVRAELRITLGELSDARRAVGVASVLDLPEKVTPDATPAEVATPPLARPLPLALLPSQVRSPIATGGIPVLAPGPCEPVRVVDLRSVRPVPDDETRPTPARTAEQADALVYAAMVEADAAELTRFLEGHTVAGQHTGSLHTGDAHHAGDYTRQEGRGSGTATLYVVRRGKHVA